MKCPECSGRMRGEIASGIGLGLAMSIPIVLILLTCALCEWWLR